MPVWKAVAVAEEPSTTLIRWQVMQFTGGSRSFIGYAVESREGRVSSSIVSFDVKTLRGVTESGRVYQLQGKPGVDTDGSYLWSRYVSGHEHEVSDVTTDVWSTHLAVLDADASPAASPAVVNVGVDHA